ncbi:MAG: hypothetical protein WBP11_14055 [Dokdonella sp.]
MSLTLSPNVLRLCDPAAAITVRWNVERPPIDRIQLMVRNVGARPKLWLRAAATGEATTGPWATEGFTIFLEDLDGNLLARASLPAVSC